MKRILFLGIGSILMMDDGIGPYLVERLKKENKIPNAAYIIGETDVDYCIDEITENDFVIIIDAVNLRNYPGTISLYSINDLSPTRGIFFSLHNFNFFDQINYFNKTINGILIGIEPAVIDYQLGLSPFLQERFDNIVDQIYRIICSIQIQSISQAELISSTSKDR